MTQNTLVYFWIAHYSDGTSLPQFNPIDYHEYSFNDIEQDKLVKFGLYPFSKDLAMGVRKTGQSVVSIPILPIYEVNLNDDKRIIHYRDVFISQEEYHFCNNCRKEFKYNKKNKIESKYSSPICPHCDSHDLFICKNCGHIHKRFEDAKFGMCNKCGAHLKRKRITSGQHHREKRWIEYYLGTQQIVNGSNVKFLLKISENGDCIII